MEVHVRGHPSCGVNSMADPQWRLMVGKPFVAWGREGMREGGRQREGDKEEKGEEEGSGGRCGGRKTRSRDESLD